MNKLMVIIFFSWISLSWATNYYVDKNANGNNNGTSWVNAWQSFGDIGWGSLGAGDTLFISGGSSGKTYTEELNIQASGNPNNDLVIRAGLDTGHNGEVKIVRGNVGQVYGITIYGFVTTREYITISNITVTNSATGIYIQNQVVIGGINHITLDSVTVSQWGETGATQTGIRINGGYESSDTTAHIDSVIITNCTISLIDSIDGQTDAIGATFMQNLIIDNTSIYLDNRSYVLNDSEPGHNDCIQIFAADGSGRVGVYNLTVTNSILTNLAGIDSVRWYGKTAHGHVIMSEDIGGDYIFYNNVLNSPFFYGYGQTVMEKQQHFGGNKKYIFIHNTFTTRQSLQFIALEQEYNPNPSSQHILKNNIFYVDTLAHDNFQYGTPDPNDYEGPPLNLAAMNFANWNQVDGNLYSTNCHRGLSDAIWFAGGDRNSAYVTSNGGESSGDFANRHLVDPLFVEYTRAGWPDGTLGTYDFHLQSGSPAINEGADLQSFVESLGLEWKDKDGKLRDSTPDCGAYQYVSRGPDITPPEVTGATLLDSVTIKIMFSEALDETTAENENNYSISNNIDIFNASLSGSEVTLETTTHFPDSYIVTVINVEDLAGNPISQSNTAEYSFPTGVDSINDGLPNEFSLHQNYPNPFNPSTTIRFSLPKDQSVKISIYNVLGELFAELTNQEYDAGTYTIDFDGSALTSGIYFYRIETPEFIETKKMVMMK